MTRIISLSVLPEMLGLWLLETAICFSALFVALHGNTSQPLRIGLLASPYHPAAANALVLALTVGIVGFAIGLYRPETCVEARRLFLKPAAAAAISLPAIWLVAKIGHINLAGLFGGQPEWPLKMLVAWWLLLLATRLLYLAALRMDMFVRRIVVLGSPQAVTGLIEAISGKHRSLFRVEPIQSAAPLSLARLSGRLWAVVFAGPPAVGLAPTLAPGVRRFDSDKFWEDQLGRVDIGAAARHDDAARTFVQAAAAASRPAVLARRFFDIVLALLLLVLTAPVLVTTALLIPLESRGPVFYPQERVGLDGRRFTLWKFRSMYQDAERLGPIWASVKDPRVTVVGRFIRKVRIDELPQLLNILRGEMSLVGPRPERPQFVAQLTEAIPLYNERALVKPGLTGWAQVNCPYGASVEDARVKLSYDLFYVKYRSLVFDLVILLATVRVILFQEGAR